MNLVLWVVQALLALHTVMGAVWKFSNPESQVPSLKAIPHGLWIALAIVELFCAVGLVAPALGKKLALAAPVAALVIAAEMLLFSGVHLASGDRTFGSVVYWLVVAAVCAFVAWGRLVLKPA